MSEFEIEIKESKKAVQQILEEEFKELEKSDEYQKASEIKKSEFHLALRLRKIFNI